MCEGGSHNTQIAGTAGKIVEYPFDTIKVRLQSQPTTPPFLYSGPWDCFRKSISPHNHNGGGGGGIRGLYRGLSAPLFGAAIETSSLFFSYRLAQTLLRSSGFLLLPSSSSIAKEGGENKINVNSNNNNNNSDDDDDDGRRGRLPLGALVACGAASGAFTSLILTPIELVKCQMQVPSPPPPPLSSSPPPLPLPLSYTTTFTTTTNISRIPPTAAAASTGAAAAVVRPPGPISIIATIYRHHGPLGFWHGQLATCIRETGGSAAWFGIYEAVSAFFRSRSSSFSSSSSSSSSSSQTTTRRTAQPLPIWQQMTAGACAGVSYIFGFFPADTIKSRMQTEAVVVVDLATPAPTPTPTPTTVGGGGVGGSSSRRKMRAKVTFWECARTVWKEQGVKGLYRGCGITVARAAPSSAFIFAIYEGLKGAF